MDKPFIQIKNQTDTAADLIINGDIMDDSWNFGDDPSATFPKDVLDALKEADGKDLTVHINSGGGHVFAGLAIHNYLKNHKGKTTAVVDGLAASIASVIACGCDVVKIPENAFFMIHKPSTWAAGNADDLRAQADTLDTIQKGIELSYKSHTIDGVTEETIHELVNEETWLTGREAAQYFDFEVLDALEAVACEGDRAKKLFNRYGVEVKAPPPKVTQTAESLAKCPTAITETVDGLALKTKECECYLYLQKGV